MINIVDKIKLYVYIILRMLPVGNHFRLWLTKEIGREYYSKKLFLKAKNEYQKAIKLNAKDYLSNLALGWISKNEGFHEEAIQYYSYAMALDPCRVEPINDLGLLYADMGAYSQAMKYFNKALELNKDVDSIFNNIAYVYELEGDYLNSIKYLSKAIEINNISTYYYRRGIAKLKRNMYSEAAEDFKKVSDLDPSNSVNLFRYGATLYRLGLFRDAIDISRQALSIKRDYHLPYITIASSYAELGELDEALKYIDLAIKFGFDDPSSHYNKGYIMYLKGNNQQALKELLVCMKMQPDYNDAKNLALKIQREERFDSTGQ